MLSKDLILNHISKCLDTKLSSKLYLNYSDDNFFNFYLEFFNVRDTIHIYLNSDNNCEHFLLEIENIDSFSNKELKRNIQSYIQNLKKDLDWYKIIL